MPEFLGNVSTEGGPLLIADRAVLATWTGIEGDDYDRLSRALDESEPRAVAVGLDGTAAVAWNVPTGTVDVWRLSPASVLLARAWVDQDEDARRVADLPIERGELLGTVTISSGWLLVMWAPEAGAGVLGVEPRDGELVDLSVGGAAIVIQLPPGDYDCLGDDVEVGSASALRCLITATPSG